MAAAAGGGERLVVIGEITRAHGLRGEVRVTPRTDDPERFRRLIECVLWDPARDRRETCRITGARRQGAALLVSLAGYETVEAAGALVGRVLAVSEADALPLGPGRFYPWQLEGCLVVDETGEEIGTVSAVEHAPAQDLWVVRGAAREHLIPAVAEIVVEVDLARRRVVVRPPEGLLDL